MMIDVDLMDRRTAMARVAMLLGAAAIPSESFAAAKRAAAKRFLTPAQLATLTAVADTLIPATDTPGAIGAGIPSTLDGMLLNWASAETKAKVTSALARIEAASLAKKKLGFAALKPAARKLMLLSHDKAALKNVTPPPGAPKVNFFSPISYVADPGYLALKGLVINLYYASEIAMTKELVYEHNPGKFQPSIKADANTRPWASVGPF
jgi:gluconate 2-dehydrogenase gamma chain